MSVIAAILPPVQWFVWLAAPLLPSVQTFYQSAANRTWLVPTLAGRLGVAGG